MGEPEALDRFFDRVFSDPLIVREGLLVSVKTRIGVQDPEEFGRLLEIFNRYPVRELIIHPRLQTDYYRNRPNQEVFGLAMEKSKNPLCYNGDLFCARRIRQVCGRFETLDRLMLGRGLLVNPGLVEKEKTGKETTPQMIWDFHETLLEGYRRELSGEQDVLFKMKELMSYLIRNFDGAQEIQKQIRRSGSLAEYRDCVRRLVSSCPLAKEPDVSF